MSNQASFPHQFPQDRKQLYYDFTIYHRLIGRATCSRTLNVNGL